MEAFGNQLEPLRAMLYQVGAFLPRLVLGLVILLAGWLVAKGVRMGVEKALRAFNFNVLFERSGLDSFLRQGGAHSDGVRVFGLLTFWLVLLLAALMAVSTMGLPNVSELLRRVIWFLPRLFVGLLILAGGSYFARFVGSTVASFGRSARLRDAAFLGKVAQYAIMVFVVLVTLDQTHIGGDLIRQSFLVILTGLVFALALAFGLGGRNWAAERIESWWPSEKKPDPEAGMPRPVPEPPSFAEGGRYPGDRPTDSLR
ncbi:MAG: mechanosensitive ion channel family protein [Ramlibacter sp.]